jgi:hypothetical protein
MKNNKHVYLLTAVLMSAGVATSAAQTQTAANTGTGAPVNEPTSKTTNEAKLDGNTALVAEFSQSLNSKNAKPGETVKAKVIQDVIAHGKVLVRRDSKLVGHITESQASNKDMPARLGIVFDKVVLKGGGELEFRGLIEAMAPPMPSPVDAPDLLGPPPMAGGSYSGSGPQPMGSSSSAASSGRSNSSTGSMSSGRPSVSGTTRSSTVGLTSDPGPPVSPAGALSIGAHGVFGIPGLRLLRGPSGGVTASVVTSMRDNVKLENGTQIVIQVEDTP